MLKLVRNFVVAGLCMSVATFANAEPYKFVRIEAAAEQIVGEVLLTEVYKRAGIEMTITPMPGKRALAEASSGQMDGETLRVFALGENVKTLIRVPTPLSDLKTVAFAKEGHDITLNDPADLNDYANVLVSGVLHTEAIAEGVSDVTEVRLMKLMFPMLQKNRADLALTSALGGKGFLKKENITDVVLVEPPLKTLKLYHYIHESKADIVPQIDAVIQEMTASGDLARIRRKAEDDYLNTL